MIKKKLIIFIVLFVFVSVIFSLYDMNKEKNLPYLSELIRDRIDFSLFFCISEDVIEEDVIESNSNFAVDVYFSKEYLDTGYLDITIHVEPINDKIYFNTTASVNVIDIKEYLGDIKRNVCTSFNLTGDVLLKKMYENTDIIPEYNKLFTGCTWSHGYLFSVDNSISQKVKESILDWVNSKQLVKITYEFNGTVFDEYLLVDIVII